MAALPTPDPKASGDGRKAAADFTSTFAPGTVGQVVHTAVQPFANWFGDFGSGTIGAHYRSRAADLAKPATGANIRAFAETETEYWKSQPGLPGMIGSSMSAQTRESMLNCMKTQLTKAGKFPSTGPK